MKDLLFNPKMILAMLIILVSVVTDLRTKKIPNQLIVIGLGLSVILIALTEGRSAIWPTLASLGTASVFAFPLYSLRAIGAGDVKLIAVISLLMNWNVIITMIFASMIWGSVLGLIRVLIAGNGKIFFKNIFLIIRKRGAEKEKLTTVPFTVAIFFGFLTSIGLGSAGILWV